MLGSAPPPSPGPAVVGGSFEDGATAIGAVALGPPNVVDPGGGVLWESLTEGPCALSPAASTRPLQPAGKTKIANERTAAHRATKAGTVMSTA
jgi:hypothetical protein